MGRGCLRLSGPRPGPAAPRARPPGWLRGRGCGGARGSGARGAVCGACLCVLEGCSMVYIVYPCTTAPRRPCGHRRLLGQLPTAAPHRNSGLTEECMPSTRRARSTPDSSPATVDLPTPPLPDATAMMCFTSARPSRLLGAAAPCACVANAACAAGAAALCSRGPAAGAVSRAQWFAAAAKRIKPAKPP